MARAGGSLRPWAQRLRTPCSPARPRPPGGHRGPRSARSQPQRGRGGSPWATSLQGSAGGAQRTGWGTGTRGGRGSPKRCSSPLHPDPTSMLSSCGGRGVGRGADQGGGQAWGGRVTPGALSAQPRPTSLSLAVGCPDSGTEAHDPGEGSAPAHRTGHSPMPCTLPGSSQAPDTEETPF